MYARCTGLRYTIVRDSLHRSSPHAAGRFRRVPFRRDGASYSSRRPPLDGESIPPKRASLRPLTLFAICIPLGYAISWGFREGDNAADGTSFVKYTLTDKQAVSSTCSIFTVRPSTTATVHTTDPALKRAITSVQFKQPQLQIARYYTLLPPIDDQDEDELRFLIRKEHNGEVSGYLHRLPEESELELRGLSAEYVLPEKVDRVLFLAGGTGIAPAMQVAQAVSNEADVHILWASRKRDDCAGGRSSTAMDKPATSNKWSEWMTFFGLRADVETTATKDTTDSATNAIVEQITRLQSRQPSEREGKGSALLVDYYVDDEGTLISAAEVGKLSKPADTQRSSNKNLLFVSGPEGFVKHWAGSKVWSNGREVQGPLGGVLGTMDVSEWEVVKL